MRLKSLTWYLIILHAVFICFSSTPLKAQEYLGDDYDFFSKKTRLFQRWLTQKDLDKYLSVDSFQLVNKSQQLELFLKIPSTNPDTVASIWRSLKENYQASASASTFQESLFQTFTQFMEINPEQGNIQIYMPRAYARKKAYNPCFYVWIWQEGDNLKEKAKIEGCKSQYLDVFIPMEDFSTASGTASMTLKNSELSDQIFQDILKFAKRKYEIDKPDCEGRNPIVLFPEKQTDFYLEFYVNDLCREILTNERQSLWCDFVELWWGPCNDMRRERLEFSINLSHDYEQVYLRIEITGKFGSGLYRPRKSGWMDMNPDFEDFLEEHAAIFKGEFIQFLRRK